MGLGLPVETPEPLFEALVLAQYVCLVSNRRYANERAPTDSGVQLSPCLSLIGVCADDDNCK